MMKTLEIFERLTKELLVDEKINPLAQHIPSSKLYETLDLSLKENPLHEEEYERILKEIVFASTRTATKGFFNQLFGGRNEHAILGELLSVILNNSMYTYKAAGPQIGIEKSLLRKICDIIGWGKNADGTLGPGGSMTNFMAMIMARDRYAPEIPIHGLNQNFCIYTSEEAHYSISKNAAFCGIGKNNVKYVATDEEGRIDIFHLEEMIKQDQLEGAIPLMINLTAGTTVLGVFDPIREVKCLSEKYNMWLHVDGAYCGSVLFSEKYKYLLDGIELVDSFSFNAHKMLGTTLSCSIIVVKNKEYFLESFSNEASYLYQTDHDEFNLGKISLQCGRRNDALKLWTLWKAVGTIGLEKIINHQFALADTARSYVRTNDNYTLYSFDESIAICFNYRDISARKLCTLLYEHSKLQVGYGTYNGIEFIRFVTINAQNSHEDILNFFKTLENFVEENSSLFLQRVSV